MKISFNYVRNVFIVYYESEQEYHFLKESRLFRYYDSFNKRNAFMTPNPEFVKMYIEKCDMLAISQIIKNVEITPKYNNDFIGKV